MKHTLAILTTLLLAVPTALQAENDYTVRAEGIEATLNADGEITRCSVGKEKVVWPLHAATHLAGCRTEGKTTAHKLPDGGCAFVRKLTDANGNACTVTEWFRTGKGSIRWEVEVTSTNAFWTTPVGMRLKFPATGATRFWTTWIGGETWSDPLALQPLADHTWGYGNGQGSICIPLASVLEPATDTGVSLIVSPERAMVWTQLVTARDGTVLFRHKLLRLGGGKTVKLTADIVAHEADWRGGLRWMVARYPEYFNPPNPRADNMAGTGSYSRRTEKLPAEDVARLKKMAYSTDWEASFTWPYFGMFMPPMPDDQATWQTYGYNTSGNHDPKLVLPMSYRQLNEKARHRKADGFFTLNYFNVTEFGVGIQDKPDVKTDLLDADCWRDANAFLHRKIADGIYRNEAGQVKGTWGNAVAMDSGGSNFQKFLLDQARAMKFLPDFDGVCIDRMDWLPRVNYSPGADDQTGWYLNGRPGRFLGLSWIETLSKLGPILHGIDKVIFVNCCKHGHRLDFMREVDGFYDEFGDNGYSLNGSSLLALRKPAIMWTHNAGSLNPDPDAFFQRHLHMGAYPTAPFPGNDHALRPSPEVDQHYLDYGPLLEAMRGKKWVLEPHCVATTAPGVKVNLFEVPGGYVLPVTFSDKLNSVVVRVRNVRGLDKARCDALHPAIDSPQPVAAVFKDGELEIQTPLHHGCALVRILIE